MSNLQTVKIDFPRKTGHSSKSFIDEGRLVAKISFQISEDTTDAATRAITIAVVIRHE